MQAAAREAIWLSAWHMVAVLLVGSLVEFRGLVHNQTLDIQVHNTFFVITWWHLTVPLAVLLAVMGTAARAGRVRFRRRATNVVLAALVGLSLVLLVGPGLWLWHGLRYGRPDF